jgi:TPR repeat protein
MRRFSFFVLLAVLAGCATTSKEPFTLLANRCDSGGGAKACAATGDYLWENNGRKLVACSASVNLVCIRSNEDRSTAVARIDELAYQYHERACKLGDAESCNGAGVYFAVKYARASDQVAPAFAAQAESQFRRACDLGSKEGCNNVGSTRPTKR